MGSKTTSPSVTDESVGIRRQMAQTRAEMSVTLEQLQARLDPVVLKEQAKTAAYDATIGKVSTMVSRTSNGFVQTIKDNPVPLALTALGIGWFIVSSRAPQMKERVTSTLGEKKDELKAQATHLAESAQTTVRDTAESAKATVLDAAHEAQMRGREVQNLAMNQFQANPIAIGLGIAAVGLVIGLAIPETRKEHEVLGAARDKLLEKAQATGQQALGKVDQMLSQGQGDNNKAPQPQQPQQNLDLPRIT